MPEYASRNFEERGFTVGIGGYAIRAYYLSNHPSFYTVLALLALVRLR